QFGVSQSALKQLVLWARAIQPVHPLPTSQHDHLSVMVRRHIGVARPLKRAARSRRNRTGHRPRVKSVALAMTADEKFRRGDETAMAGTLSTLGAHEHQRQVARLLWTEAPRQLNHLHAVVAVPYDD